MLAITHASLAEICFGLTVAIAAGYYGGHGAGSIVARLAVAVLFVQAVLGAAVGQARSGRSAHRRSRIAAGVAMWASLGVMVRHLDDGKMPRPALALLGFTAVQVFSGVAAYSVRAAPSTIPNLCH